MTEIVADERASCFIISEEEHVEHKAAEIQESLVHALSGHVERLGQDIS